MLDNGKEEEYIFVKMNMKLYSYNREGKMPIVMAPMNVPVTVIKIMTEEKVKKHLENLGITTGSTVTVLSEECGSVVLMVKEGRLALDKNLATKILVRV